MAYDPRTETGIPSEPVGSLPRHPGSGVRGIFGRLAPP